MTNADRLCRATVQIRFSPTKTVEVRCSCDAGHIGAHYGRSVTEHMSVKWETPE